MYTLRCQNSGSGRDNATCGREDSVSQASTQISARCFKEKAQMCDADEDEDAEDEAEVYLPGRTFNNLVFDAYWWSSSPALRGAGERISAKFGVAV